MDLVGLGIHHLHFNELGKFCKVLSVQGLVKVVFGSRDNLKLVAVFSREDMMISRCPVLDSSREHMRAMHKIFDCSREDMSSRRPELDSSPGTIELRIVGTLLLMGTTRHFSTKRTFMQSDMLFGCFMHYPSILTRSSETLVDQSRMDFKADP